MNTGRNRRIVMRVSFVLLTIGSVLFDWRFVRQPAHLSDTNAVVDELIARSLRRESFGSEEDELPIRFTARHVPLAEDYIRSHADFTSYHLLMRLERDYPESYTGIPDARKAAILCSALANVNVTNDWGYLQPCASYDAESARALLRTGAVALPYLIPLLNDKEAARLEGSQEATLSVVYDYRVADYAYRYACLILGIQPVFHRYPEQRDKEIEELKRRLRPSLVKQESVSVE